MVVSILQTSVLLTFGLRLCFIVLYTRLELSRNWQQAQASLSVPKMHYCMTVLQRLCTVLYDDVREKGEKTDQMSRGVKRGTAFQANVPCWAGMR